MTFKVVNGSWDEGEGDTATADKTVTLTGHDGDTLKLTADQIPAVGTKQNDTCKAGSWDTTPSVDTAITATTTYTYTYAAKESATATKTPTANTLTYNGKAKELVTAGTATGGTLYYAVTTENTAPTDDNLYDTSIPSKTDVGAYTVWYKVEGDSNHNDSIPASVSVSITKAPLTITAKDKTIAYGEAPASDGVKYDSFVEGEDESVLTGELSYTYSYKQGDTSGEYTITPSGLTSDNYEITFVDDKLTVNALGEAEKTVKDDTKKTDTTKKTTTKTSGKSPKTGDASMLDL